MSVRPPRDIATLLEALPYIREFHGQTVVIKYGGAAMVDAALEEEFARDVVLLKYVGMNPVVVHGGGPEITSYMERLDLPVEFVDGLRVSDAATVEVAKMVLVGKVNKDIVLLLGRHGQPAVGLCGDDGLLFRAARQAAPSGQDIGFVGKIERVDVDVLTHIAQDYIPVVASVGADREGNSYNINADEAAGAVARALGAYKIMFLTDVAGLAARSRRIPTASSPRPARTRSRPRSGHRRGHAPQARRLPGRDRRRGVASPTSSTAACPTRCCSSCSPTPGRGPRSGPSREPRRLAELQELERDYAIGTYVRNPVQFVRGEGVRLWDADGHEYLDFLAGISVLNVGHCHPAGGGGGPRAGRAAHPRHQPLLHRGRAAALGRAGPRARWAARCSCATRAPRPTRRRSSWPAAPARCGNIVVLEEAFHGRTYGALSATPQESKQAPFAPLVPGFVVVPKDPEALAAAVDGDTAAVLLEPIQGETGINVLSVRAARWPPARPATGPARRSIFDEIQTGMGRTGHACGPMSRPASCPTR